MRRHGSGRRGEVAAVDEQCQASLERLSWWPRVDLLRVGPNHLNPYSPWRWACTVRWRFRGRAELLGAMRAPSGPERRAARQVLTQAGARQFLWERVEADGSVRRVRLGRNLVRGWRSIIALVLVASVLAGVAYAAGIQWGECVGPLGHL
jgi:hypothetical protein